MKLAFWPVLVLFLIFLSIYPLAFRRRRRPAQCFTGPFDAGPSSRIGIATLFPTLAGLFLIALSASRPQSGFERLPDAGEGVDIIITLDVSTSMLERDYMPNRLEAAKAAALNFIRNRPTDRVGLVVYAAEPLALCPPTLDHGTLSRFIQKAGIGTLDDGTAIGAGLAIAARELEGSQTSRRVIILLSDGMENAGTVDPIQVATAIRTLHGDSLRVYTVAIGTNDTRTGVDEETLSRIAAITGGRLFDAGSPSDLADVYAAIDSLEASTLPPEGLFVYRDRYLPLLFAGLMLLAFGGVLRWKLRKVAGD